jgi:tellurite resistance protein
MGLLRRTLPDITKTPTDTVLLVHGMMLMSDFRDDEERAVFDAFLRTLPELKGADLRQLEEAVARLRGDGVQALARLSSPALKQKMFVLAVDIAMSSGMIDDREDALLDAMQATLGIDLALAEQVVEVLSLKYAT